MPLSATPVAIVDKLNVAINTTLKAPEVNSRLKALGADAMGGPPSQLDAYFKSEVGKWSKLAEQVKFDVDD